MSTPADLAAIRQLTAARRMIAALSDLGLLTTMPSDPMREIVHERLAGLKLSISELKAARRTLAKTCHPDRIGARGDHRRMGAVNAVIDALAERTTP